MVEATKPEGIVLTSPRVLEPAAGSKTQAFLQIALHVSGNRCTPLCKYTTAA